jgi:hypothetical protein
MFSRIGLSIAALALAAMVSARPVDGEKGIVVDRQIWLDEFDGIATAAAKTATGDLVVSGYKRAAWAVVTNAQGSVLWKYIEPFNESIALSSQIPESEFHGVVPLQNGNFLFCGKRASKLGKAALIMIFSSDGRIIEERAGFSNGTDKLTSSNIARCFKWRGGVALLGGADTGTYGFNWIMKLDKNGVKEWQTPVTLSHPTQPMDPAAESLVITMLSPPTVSLFRVGSKGEELARRAIDRTYDFLELRPMQPTNTTTIIGYEGGNKETLYTLGEGLQDVLAPIALADFDSEHGIGYVRSDKSLALFLRGTFGGIFKPEVALMSSFGQFISRREFNQMSTSMGFADAVPVSEDQFVAVASGRLNLSSPAGLSMTWISFR